MLGIPIVTFAFVMAAGPAAPRPDDAAHAATRPVTCTFSNPSYSGDCHQPASATPDQTANDACQAILACLNDVQCIKTYCNATQIRGGWHLVSAQEGSGDDREAP
ncbi:MAG: hypothetical protein ACM3JH_12810 [Acidithiobacillales bacterium]